MALPYATDDARKERTPRDGGLSGFSGSAGGGLLSRDLSIGVPSALQGLTTVFGMGTGVAPALQPPAIFAFVGPNWQVTDRVVSGHESVVLSYSKRLLCLVRLTTGGSQAARAIRTAALGMACAMSTGGLST